MAQTVKNLPAMQETRVRFLGQEDPLEEGLATHSSILAWGIPRSLVGYRPRGCKESDTTERLHFHSHKTTFKNSLNFTPTTSCSSFL